MCLCVAPVLLRSCPSCSAPVVSTPPPIFPLLTASICCARFAAMKILDIPQSGSIAGETSSRNRFGQYRRSRATPINPNSNAQGVVRARLGGNAAAWRGLTDNQRAGWTSLGAQMTRADSLGQSYTLSGFQCFNSVNNNLSAAGDSSLADAPALVTPQAIASVTVTTTAGTLSVAYTPTPLGTGVRAFLFASPQRSAGRSYEGDYRLIAVTAAAAASPHNLLTTYSARCGVPVVGNKIFFNVQAYKGGFLGATYATSKVVSA